MTVIGIYEGKTHFSELVKRASRGEEFVITKNGKVLAHITPPRTRERADTAVIVSQMLDYRDRQNRTTDSMTIKEMTEAGRRF
jgi:prevent-host-death family protein